MLSEEKVRKTLEKQGHRFVGNHSSVKICRWTKKSLVDEGECYKNKFYGIKSHRCCQMSPSVGFCQNKCLHCWRPIEFNFKVKDKIDEPKEIIEKCIRAQRKLLTGFKGNSKINLEKLKEAQEPMQFAISLTGEPTLYLKLGKLIKRLCEQGKTSFLVTNGLRPEVLRKLSEENCLPTQLYISLNTPNKEMYEKWHRSSEKDAWKKFNESLRVMSGLNCRRVIRMTLVKDLNMGDNMVKDYVKLIKKSECDWIEVKGFMSVGFARQRLGYDKMPSYEEVKNYAKKIIKELKKDNYKILDEHEFSRVVLAGKDEKIRKIQKD